MATTDTKINIEVGAFLNKQEYEQVAKQLENLMHILNDKKNKTTTAEDKKLLEQQFKIVEKTAIAYDKAFSSKTGQINISKLNEEMKKSNVTVEQFRQTMAKSGQEGAQTYNQWANSILNANIQLKESNKLLDRMAVTFKNTIRYGISSSIFNNFTNSVQKAYNYTKNLDTSLNDIRIVSGQSAEQMADLAVSANKAAQALGKTTLDYTKAATIYYQQGLNSDEVEKRTEATLKAANVTGQNAQEVSEQLTAVWNGYRVTGEELELYVDKLAAVAAHSASNLEELSTGMSKVASAANIMGVSIDQLTAQMSTIVSVTRQAPESVGTALRTIYARMADIKSGLDDETSLGNYSGKMKKLGFDVLDSSNNLKDMGVVIEEVGNKWKDLSREQQVALAQIMAGTRQYNNLLTLFDNWDKYQDALEIAGDAAGTLQQQQDIYMESTAAHLEQLQATAEETYSALFDQETARDFIDLVTNGLSTINKYLNGLNTGALGGVLGQLGTLGANLFSGQIASGISGQLNKNRVFKENQAQFQTQEDILKSGYLTENDKNASLASKNRLENRAIINEALGGMDEQKQQELLKTEQELFQLQVKKGERLKQYREDYNKLVDIEKDSKKIEQDYNNIIKEKADSQEDSLNLTKEQMNAIDRMSQLQKAREDWDQYTDEDAADAEREDALTAQIAKSAELGSEQQRINDIIRGTTALLGTWNNLMTGINLITDENLSTWEKFQGLIGVAGTQLMLLLTSYQSLTNLMPALIIQTKIYTGEQFKEAAAAVGVAAAEGKELTIKQAKEAIEKMSLATKIKLLAIKIKEWAVEKGKLIIEQAALIIGRLTNVQKTIEIAQRAANTAAINGENVALAIMKALLGDISGVALVAAVAVGALAVALGAALVAIVEGNTGLNGYNKAIEEAAIHTQEVKDAYNELKETIASYKDARNGIDQLTVGTLEYYDAIIKANEEASKLIDTLGLLVGEDYKISESGLIQIDDKTLNKIQFKEGQKVYGAQANEFQKRLDKANYQLQEAGVKLNKAIIDYDRYWADVSKEDLHKKIIEQGQWDITNWELAEKAAYSQAYEEVMTLKRGLADNIIRAYSSQANVEIYNNMADNAKKYLQEAVAKEAEANTNSAAIEQDALSIYENIPFVKDIIGGIGGFLANIAPSGSLGKILTSLQSYTLMPFAPGLSAGIADKYQEKEVKEQYLKDFKNYTQEGGFLGIGTTWKDDSGRVISDIQKVLDEVDLDEALTAIRGGQKEALAKSDTLISIYDSSLQKAGDLGLSSAGQKYYAQFAMGRANNDWTTQKENWNLLTSEERAKLAENDEVIADRVYYGDLSLTQSNADIAKRNSRDTDEYNQTLADQAEQLDTTTAALEVYGTAMRNAGTIEEGLNAETAQQIANSYKFNKAYNEAVKTYQNNIDAVKKFSKAMEDGQEVDYETADAVGEVITQLKQMGLSLSASTIANHLDEINALLTGTEEEAKNAYQALYELAQLDALKEMFGDSTAEQQLAAFGHTYQELVDEINNTTPGKNLEEEYEQSLRKMLDTTDYTIEEINALSQKLGIEIPVEYQVPKNFSVKDVDFTTKATSVTHRYTGEMPNPHFGVDGDTKKTVAVDYAWVETTEEKHDSFKIPEDTNFKVNTVKQTSAAGANFSRAPSNNKSSKSGSSAKPSKKDPNKDELDRYQLVNVQLKEIGKQLTALDKQKKKLLGGDLVKNLNKQVDLLNRQIEVTEAKLKIAQDEQTEVAGNLSKYGIRFDSDGNIANYAQIFKQEQNKLNAVYAAFNGMSKDAQEAYQDTVKAAEESWKTFKDSISKYDNLIGDTIPQLYQDLQDAYDKQTENLIEQFNMEIKIRLDMAEATRDWNDFKRKVIDGVKDSDILGTAKARLKDFFTYYNEEGTAEVQKLTERVQKQLEEIRKQEEENGGEWYRDNDAQAFEDLKEYYEKLKEGLTDIIELEEEMHQKFLDAMDEAQDKFDDQVDTFENINKHLEHNIELINLLTDQNDYERLAEQYAAQTKNRQEELAFYTQQKDFWAGYLDTLQEGTDEWENAKAKYNEAAEAWANALESTIQAARTEFENNLNAIFKAINNQLTNNKGLDYLNEQWELLGTNSELVLDNINKMQGFQELTKKYNDAINSTSNIAAQKKLAQLRDQELESMKTMGSLSEKDLERAEKKLEIVKAQIALEDAQRNKSQMRLRRDSQGNYRYQFVADEDEIRQAQQDLYAAYNELYNFDKSRYISNLNDAAQAWQEYQEKMAEAALINDPEVRAEKEALIKEQYDERIGILHEQLQRTMQELNESTFAELNALYGENEANYELMTDEQKAALNDFERANQTAFDLVFSLYTDNTQRFHDMTQDELDIIQNQLVPQWTAGYQDLVKAIEGEGGIEQVSNRMMAEMQGAIDAYNDSLVVTETVAGNTFETIASAQSEVITKTEAMLKDNSELIDQYQTMIDEVKKLYYGEEGNPESGLLGMMKAFEDQAEAAKKAAEDAYNKIKQMNEAQADAAKKNVDEGSKANNAPTTPVSQPTAVPGSSGSGGGDGVPNIGDRVKFVSGDYYADSYGGGRHFGYHHGEMATITYQNPRGTHPYHLNDWGWVKKDQITGYDTGGYTGEWGNSGRLAMLHQKELVLNNRDTVNMLNAVEIMRSITDNIGADLLGRMAGMTAGGFSSSVGNGILDQNVHIEATFPGVKSSVEIQDALNNLVNMAAQRATSTR